jgi:hypothetical protein
VTSQKTIEKCRERVAELERLADLQHQAMTAVQITNARIFKELGEIKQELKLKNQKVEDLQVQNTLLRRNIAAGLWEVPECCK